MDPQSRTRLIYRVTLAGSAVNVVLVVLKFIAGVVGRSSAMVADAVHSLSDFATDVVVLLFVRISRRPQDAAYDYGYGKYETIATLIIGMALLVVGAGIAYSGASKIYEALHGAELEAPSALAFWMAIISIAAKEICYRITAEAGRKAGDTGIVKTTYGQHITFWGGISTQGVLPFGTPGEVAAETQRVIDLMSAGGGYITCSSQEIQTDVPYENLKALIDTARANG